MTRPLYCDESIWIPVADGLRRRGWPVKTARGQDTLGDPDRQQLQYATENEWVFLTVDDDFLSLVASQELEHAGLIYIDQRGRQIGDVVKTVDTHLDTRADDDYAITYL